MSFNLGKIIYENCHKIPVLFDGESEKRNVSFKVFIGPSSTINIKIIEVDNFKFNYTCHIDQLYFNRIKAEQSLEICFEELHSQVLDLLQNVKDEKMFLRLDASGSSCNMVFYENSKLKTIIFLTISLNITDQTDIINEISINLQNLKDSNRNLLYEIGSVKAQLNEKDILLQSSLTTNRIIDQQFKKDIASVEKLLISCARKFHQDMDEKILTINRKHIKLLNDIEILKAENKLKCESSIRLVNSMQNLRLENERNIQTIENFKIEINHLNILRKNSEETCGSKLEEVLKLENANKRLQLEMENQKKDLENASLIIAQKTKANDEITKDLVQANTMLVNFNNQCDVLCKKLDEKQDVINKMDAVINEQSREIKQVVEEYNKYKKEHKEDDLVNLRQEIHSLRKTIQELEKHNKEANKMNELLARKLSSGLRLP